MSTITAMVQDQDLNVNAFEKFISVHKDEDTAKYGFFDMYCRDTMHLLGLFGDVIVVLSQHTEYSDMGGGIGHKFSVYAVSTDMKERWDCNAHIDTRDSYSEHSDRRGPLPQEFLSLVKHAAGNLTVEARMPECNKTFHFKKKK